MKYLRRYRQTASNNGNGRAEIELGTPFYFLSIWTLSGSLEIEMSALSEAQQLALRTFVQRIVGPTPNLELDGRFIHHIIDYTYEPRYVWFAPCGGVIVTVMLLYQQGNDRDGRYVALVCTNPLPI